MDENNQGHTDHTDHTGGAVGSADGRHGCADLEPVSIQLPDWDEPAAGRLLHQPAVALLELSYDSDTDGTDETEVLSVDLAEHGLTAAPGEVWVRDWSEHAGLPEALETAGAVEILERRPIGPFDAVAVLCRVRPAGRA